jgi:hypothetical protein
MNSVKDKEASKGKEQEKEEYIDKAKDQKAGFLEYT